MNGKSQGADDASSPTEELLVQARAGSPAALNALFAEAGDRLSLFVSLRIGGRLSAELEPQDVVQETWMAALEGLDRFEARGPGSFSAWLCRIAENRLRDLGRRGGRLKRTPPGTSHPATVLLAEARASITGPFSAAARSDENRRLADAVELLDEPDREALLMRHFEELTLDEIAHRMGASPTAVRRRLGRVLGALGERLG